MATYPPHVVSRAERDGPDPEPFATPARIRAAVSRASRAYAMAADYLPAVLGEHSAVSEALRVRVDALRAAPCPELPYRAVRLHDLTAWIGAVAEAIELESHEASSLRPWLASIIAECELIASAGSPRERDAA